MHFVRAKGILSAQNGMNLYRGCMHGCIYCDSRSVCYHMDHAFEDIEVKENAIELLEAALRRKRKKCMIGTGAMTDPYMPLEKELCYTRRALEAIERYGFGVSLLTKSDLILRDMDLLTRINQKAKCVVQMTLTTCDPALCKKLEPNVADTQRRFEVLKTMRDAGIPTVVWLSPILPFINATRENVEGILDRAQEARAYGVMCFGMGLTLRDGDREYFYQQLDRLFPGLKERYIRAYGQDYMIPSPNNDALMELFWQRCEQCGMVCEPKALFDYAATLKEETGGAEQLSFLT